MKKVLFFSHYPTQFGIDGANKILYLITKGFNNHEKIVVTPEKGGLSDLLAESGIKELTINYTCFYYNQIIRETDNPSELVDKLTSEVEKSNIFSFFKEWQPDLVYVNTIMATCAAVAGKMVNAKIVWHVHDILENNFSPANQIKMVNILDRFSDKVIVVSKAVKHSIMHVGKSNKCEQIYNGIEIPSLPKQEYSKKRILIRNKYKIPKQAPVIGFLGQIKPIKGAHQLLRAAKFVLNTHPRTRFIIAGNEKQNKKYTAILKNITSRLSLEDHVIWASYINNLDNIFPGIDCLVVPSIFEDPLPTVVIEANSYHVPVIGYKSGGIPELITHGVNGYLVEKENISALANMINTFLNSPGLRKKMGNLGYERVQELFNYERFSKDVNQVINDVIGVE